MESLFLQPDRQQHIWFFLTTRRKCNPDCRRKLNQGVTQVGEELRGSNKKRNLDEILPTPAFLTRQLLRQRKIQGKIQRWRKNTKMKAKTLARGYDSSSTSIPYFASFSDGQRCFFWPNLEFLQLLQNTCCWSSSYVEASLLMGDKYGEDKIFKSIFLVSLLPRAVSCN